MKTTVYPLGFFCISFIFQNDILIIYAEGINYFPVNIKNKLPGCTEFLVRYLSLRILAFQKVKFYIFLLFRTHTLLKYRLWYT